MCLLNGLVDYANNRIGGLIHALICKHNKKINKLFTLTNGVEIVWKYKNKIHHIY